jgi:hypothetical protein
MDAAKLLEYVLENSDVRLNPIKQALSGRELAILEITHGDGQALLDIYSTRTEIAAQKGRSEENYKDLITNMKNERSKRVTVLHAGTKENVFLIFTDSDNRKILGVIPGYKPS